MSTSRSLERLFKRKKEKEFEERKQKFLTAHRENVRKYRCDFQSKIFVVDEGRQAMAVQEIVDATEMLKEQEAKVEANNKGIENE